MSVGEKQVNYLENPLEIIEQKAEGGIPVFLGPEDAAISGLRESLQARRLAILEFPSWESGLDMNRIGAYRELIGAPKKEIRVLSPTDYAKAKAIAKMEEDELEGGAFLTVEDVVIVKRDPEEEAELGAGLTESRIIHEIAHSSTNYPVIRISGREVNRRFLRKNNILVNADKARTGFAVFNKRNAYEGLFLEEGYAEYERGRYIVDSLGLPDGFIKRTEENKADFLNKYVIPTKNQNGSRRNLLAPGAIPAATLELLIEHDPELLDHLRNSRHSAESLREVARKIDSLQPGLYKEMRKIDIRSEGNHKRCVELYTKVYKLLKKEPDVPQ